MDPKTAQTLRPSARLKLVARLAQTKDEKVINLENLAPLDYGHYLIHSLDLKIIIPALSHSYPRTRHFAVKALLKAWLRLSPSETIEYGAFAAALYELALESLHPPPALLRLDTFLKQILPPLIGLAKDQVAVAECLIHQAGDAAEEDSLLRYRLAQQFVDYHGLTTTQREEMAKIITKMENHPDAMVRSIALDRN